MKENQNPHLVWDKIWDNYTNKSDIDALNRELTKSKKSNTWKNYTEIVDNKFGGWKNVVSIELGSGLGGHSLMAASEGATVYLLDYSKPALELAEKKFNALNLKGNFLYGNAFDSNSFKKADFNLSWSFGTAEHFEGPIRKDFFNLHFDYIINNGLTIISCPYKYSINYRIWMHYAVKFKEWDYGLEIPFSKSEYLSLLNQTQNKLVKIYFDEGRPCLSKAIKILKKHSKLRFLSVGYLLRLGVKLKLKVQPFYFRSIILIAEKT
jgi:2-polyprenyl-3-methyl-5-hydroxy-6-metoxy-1,4-benzoquinol methylase